MKDSVMSQKFWRIPYVYSVVELLKIVLPEFGESIEFATAQMGAF
jgi:hypothetical protein